MAGLGPPNAAQADVDAFLRGLPPQAAPHPADFAQFESIYAQRQHPVGPLLGGPPLPGMAQGRAAAAPLLQVRPSLISCWCIGLPSQLVQDCVALACEQRHANAATHPCRCISLTPGSFRAIMQAFLDSSKAHAPFRPLPAAAPPGVALSLPDQLRVRDRSTIMARQLFAEQGAAFADEQVGRLLASLNINPMELPAAGPGQATSWDRIFGAAAGPRLAQPSAASEHAAAAAMAAHHGQQEQWAQEFERMRLGAAGPSSSAAAWAAEHQQQQQPAQAQRRVGWEDEFAAEGGSAAASSSGWVDEFQSTAAAGSAMRQRAGGDALEQTKRLADTLAGGAVLVEAWTAEGWGLCILRQGLWPHMGRHRQLMAA